MKSTENSELKAILIFLLVSLLLISPKIILSLPANQGDFLFFAQNEQIFLSSSKKGIIEPSSFILINQNSLQATLPLTIFSSQPTGILVDSEERNQIINYLVESGDNLWSIADKFNISLNTIIWANDLRKTTIRPGQKLVILPVSGVRHIVKRGDILSQIAERYNANLEEIIDFNNISNEANIFVGQVIIVPGGEIGEQRSRALTQITNANITTLTPDQVRIRFSTNNYWGQSHSFPFGQCTWWVAQKRSIGRWGHAKSWLDNAEKAGFQVCRGRYCSPKEGAVIAIKSNSPLGLKYGHVAYVEEINNNRITYSEMNYIGWGRINKQVIKIGDYEIIGFIY
jgi:surface antigen